MNDIFSILNGLQVVGIVCYQWGDTGKGKFTLLYSDWADVTSRGAGGPNAGHTGYVNGQQVILHQLPMSILSNSRHKISVLGNGMVINPAELCKEIDYIHSLGFNEYQLMISQDAHVIMPYHIEYDKAKNQSQAKGGVGSTGRGIGPCYTDKIASKIEFKNSKVDGLGMPLPKGIVKIYKLDEADDNLEFIGEDRIDHIATDEKVTLTTGYAFDLIGETKVTDTRKISKRINEKDIIVTLKNRSQKTKTINVIHNISGNWEIFNNNIEFKKEKANQIEFEKTLKPNTTFEITWTERIEY